MSAFNTTVKGKNAVPTIVNHEGAPAFALNDKLELYSAVTTFLFKDSYYETGDTRIARIRELAKRVPPEFVAKLAVYAREQMHLRSIPIALCVELAAIHNGDSLVSRTVNRVVQRADEITELLAYYQRERKGQKKLNKLSKQLQLGLASAFNKFNEYQFSKYNKDSEIKLRDALFLVHPSPKNQEQQDIFNRIATNTLKTADTWEVALSAAGQTEGDKLEHKKEAWESLIMEQKLPYMAALRNLRNILEAGVSQKALQSVCSLLSDKERVVKSKQFPYRFLSAYRELPITFDTPLVKQALETAMRHAAANVQGFSEEDRVVIATDWSGSMRVSMSDKSKIQRHEAGAALSFILANRCQRVMSVLFGDNTVWLEFDPLTILSNIEQALKLDIGYSTNGWKVLRDMLDKKLVADKVYFFTDCQLWDSTAVPYGAGWQGSGYQSFHKLWAEYKSKVNAQAKLYIIDMAGHGNTPIQVMSPNVYYAAGFSERLFEVLETMQNGDGAIKAIDSIII